MVALADETGRVDRPPAARRRCAGTGCGRTRRRAVGCGRSPGTRCRLRAGTRREHAPTRSSRGRRSPAGLRGARRSSGPAAARSPAGVPCQYVREFASFQTTTARACGTSAERGPRVAAEAVLRVRRRRRLRAEAEDREHDLRVARGLGGAGELDPADRARSRAAVPRHPDAHGIGAERALAPDDRQRVGRPLERVVVDADEQRVRPRDGRAGPERAVEQDRAGRQYGDGREPGEDGDQAPAFRPVTPSSDWRRTRHAVAITVRR